MPAVKPRARLVQGRITAGNRVARLLCQARRPNADSSYSELRGALSDFNGTQVYMYMYSIYVHVACMHAIKTAGAGIGSSIPAQRPCEVSSVPFPVAIDVVHYKLPCGPNIAL